MAHHTIVTHSGNYHPDDVLAVATLTLWLDAHNETYDIIRSRDKEVIEKADYVIDVGGVHDHDNRRYDHHQTGGAGVRDNGIEYASFGLIWKYYGHGLVTHPDNWQHIDDELVASVDANDSGQHIATLTHPPVDSFTIGNVLSLFKPSWNEDFSHDTAFFEEALPLARKVLDRFITSIENNSLAEQYVEDAYHASDDKRIIILSQHASWKKVLWQNYSEPLFVLFPNEQQDGWVCRAIPTQEDWFKPKKPFPSAWAGLRDEELANVSGIEGARFCHNDLFIFIGPTQESALQAAHKALDE